MARNARELATAAEVVSTLDPSRRWVVEIREQRSKRTGPQNRLLWAIYTAIADATGYTPEEVHEAMKAKFLPPRAVALGKEEVEVPGSTAVLEVPEFSEYVERVQAFAATELGVQA
jgi:hypothetical protein